MDEQTGVWLRDGNTLYLLESCGFRRGKEQFQNKVWVNVYTSAAHAKEIDETATKVHAFLKRENGEATGAELQEQVKAARAAFEKWVQVHYPIGSPADFEPFPGSVMMHGEIVASGLDRYGKPEVTVEVKGRTNKHQFPVNPIAEVIKIVETREAETK
jgi:hypothetical protein